MTYVREDIAAHSPEEIERMLRAWGEGSTADIEIYVQVALMFKQGVKQVDIAKHIGKGRGSVGPIISKVEMLLRRQNYKELKQAKAETAYDQ